MPSSSNTRASPRVLLRSPPELREEGWPRAIAVRPGERVGSRAGLHRRPWLERLRRALEDDLFVLHFQPIVCLRERTVSHHEALLRLADDPGGLIAPGCFLPAAERHGLIRRIDRMVLGKVIALLAREHAGRGTPIAVNLSAVSVTDPSMLGFLHRRLAETGVDPSLLVIELTETAAISDMGRARAFCAAVLELGCAVALDDFGVGFGSFQYLKQLPFTQLKIDGDFIRRLPISRTDQLLVKAIAGVARGMGRQTVAECVGDEQTMTMLEGYGVDYAQGFELGRPLAALPIAC